MSRFMLDSMATPLPRFRGSRDDGSPDDQRRESDPERGTESTLEDDELPDRKGRDANTRQDEQDRQRRDEYRHRTKLSPPPRSRIWRAVSKRALRRRERRGFALGDLTPRDPADQ